MVLATSQQEFSDAEFRIVDNGDQSKKLAFELSGIATGTTRTWTVPDANVTVSSFAATFLDDTSAPAARATIGAMGAASQADQETGVATTVSPTPTTQHFHPSAAKAWAHITVSGGVPSLAASYNISGIGDTGPGQCAVAIGNDMSSAAYVVVVSGNGNDTVRTFEPGGLSGSGFAANCVSASLTFADPAFYSLACFGDQ
jgi:hypothetical protein